METQTTAQTNERRKQELITEGFVYRGNVRSATARVKAGLHPETMAHGVLGVVTKTALALFAGRAALGSGGLAGLGLKTVFPLALTAVNMLRNSSFRASSLVPRLPHIRKPTLIKGGIAAGIIGAFAAVGAYVLRQRRAAADL